MFSNRRIELRLRAEDFMNRVAVCAIEYVREDGTNEWNESRVVAPTELLPMVPIPEGSVLEPTFEISIDAAQKLCDDLYANGFTPKRTKDIERRFHQIDMELARLRNIADQWHREKVAGILGDDVKS